MGEQVVTFSDTTVQHDSILNACKSFENDPFHTTPPCLEPLRELKVVYDRQFIMPLLNGCRKLVQVGDGADKVNVLERVYKEILSLGLAEHGFILAWLSFQISRLQNFNAGHTDFQNLYKWLRICYNTADPRWSPSFISYGLSRDEEMRQIVFDDNGLIREFFLGMDMPGRVYLQKLAAWFLGRYDLDAAFSVLDELSLGPKSGAPIRLEVRPSGEKGRRQRHTFQFSWSRFGWKLPLLILATIIFLWIGATGNFLQTPLPHGWWKAIYRLSGAYAPVINSINVRTSIVLPYTFFPLLVIISTALWFRRGVFNRTRKMLPRLFGGVLIGYIPLVSSEDLWKWLLTLPTLPAVSVWTVSLVVSYLYLLMEARNVVADGKVTKEVKCEVWVRTTQVFLIGLTETYLVGLLLGELIGFAAMSGVINSLPEGMTYHVINNWGTLVPRVVLLYAPVALFLGILVQLIWEEKTVTQPL